jgi:hypothetical protein
VAEETVMGSSTANSMLWRRLDAPGHDACRLVREGERWRLEGVAAFRDDRTVAQLAYRVTCDQYWRTLDAHVHGSLGSVEVDIGLRRSARGVWILNGEAGPDLPDCVDVDLGFTAATNALQIRRIALRVGQSAHVPVAWLDVAGRQVSMLEQRFDYAGMLVVNSAGFPVVYPNLWEEEQLAIPSRQAPARRSASDEGRDREHGGQRA